MYKLYGADADNKMLPQLFRKAELSFIVVDLSKYFGPMVDLLFISMFIGSAGVTVLGYTSPLLLLLELILRT